jgi:hypothetical protein
MHSTSNPTKDKIPKRKIIFRARVDWKKRIQIPSRELTFKHGDKVKVIVEDLEID